MQQLIKQIKSIFDCRRLLKACGHSICGFQAAWQKDVAFKQETFLTIIIIPLAIILGATVVEKVLLIGSWFLVLLTELINSSIEALVDRISLEIHPLSKKIKDISSAAVLLAVINVTIVWAIILISHLVKI